MLTEQEHNNLQISALQGYNLLNKEFPNLKETFLKKLDESVYDNEEDDQTIYMADSCQCILGLLYGGYYNGLEKLSKVNFKEYGQRTFSIWHDFAVRYGFNIPESIRASKKSEYAYIVLGQIWLNLIFQKKE